MTRTKRRIYMIYFFFSSRRRHTRWPRDWSSDVCSSDLMTASLLRRNPQTSAIKVVLITARAQEDDKTRGRQIGVDAYLTKPFDPSEMIRVVRELAGHPPIADAG